MGAAYNSSSTTTRLLHYQEVEQERTPITDSKQRLQYLPPALPVVCGLLTEPASAPGPADQRAVADWCRRFCLAAAAADGDEGGPTPCVRFLPRLDRPLIKPVEQQASSETNKIRPNSG